jgi:hypothetical protein
MIRQCVGPTGPFVFRGQGGARDATEGHSRDGDCLHRTRTTSSRTWLGDVDSVSVGPRALDQPSELRRQQSRNSPFDPDHNRYLRKGRVVAAEPPPTHQRSSGGRGSPLMSSPMRRDGRRVRKARPPIAAKPGQHRCKPGCRRRTWRTPRCHWPRPRRDHPDTSSSVTHSASRTTPAVRTRAPEKPSSGGRRAQRGAGAQPPAAESPAQDGSWPAGRRGPPHRCLHNRPRARTTPIRFSRSGSRSSPEPDTRSPQETRPAGATPHLPRAPASARSRRRRGYR